MTPMFRQFRPLAMAMMLLGATTMAAPAVAAEPEDAAQFIRDLGNRAIAELADDSTPMEKRVDKFRAMVNDGFAMNAISRFVLGRYARVASDEEMAEFHDVFLKVVTQRFLPLFEGYTEADFKVDGAKVDPRSDKLFLVQTRVRSPRNENFVKAGWRVQDRENDMQIVDVLAEGVSMAITLRSEYSSVIQQNGGQVAALIEKLEKNVEKGTYESKSVSDAVQ